MKQNYFNMFENVLKNLKEVETYLSDMNSGMPKIKTIFHKKDDKPFPPKDE